MNESTSCLILIDPSSPAGEDGLRLIEPGEREITLLLLLDDPSAGSLEAFARSERIGIGEAADIYLQQVADRIPAGCAVASVSTNGHDAVREILLTMADHGATRVVVPSSLPGLGGDAIRHLVSRSTAPVVVAPALAA